MKAALIASCLLSLCFVLAGCATQTCETDQDCGFYFTRYTWDNPCGNCSYDDPGYACMSNDNGKDYTDKQFARLFGDAKARPACSPCPPSDYDTYECRCVEKKCTKTAK